jgi:heme-degrading monooxygenase HmoA
MAHVRIWQFRPDPGREEEFRRAYAGDGRWAKLFERAEGYLGTELLGPDEPGGAWLTLDRWESRTAFERFRQDHGEAYRRLDEELEGLAGEERFIGAFEG